ncbi:MAG: agmatinase, partial [Alphaproteobacteria bacterium]|nr:agmatinase [Alphaproteobacteria bacterium]
MSELQLRPRYSGVATFFRTPLVDSLQDVDIGVIGVPFDGGVTNRTGTRHGPRAVREQTTLIRRVNQATGITPFDLMCVADCGDAFLEGPYELIAAHKEIEDYFAKFKASKVTTLGVGGDHSISLPILRAIAKDGPVGMIHIDAHCDTGDDYLGSKFHHGAPFSRAVEEGLLDPKRVIQIGIRGSINSKDMWKFSHDSGMRVVYME